MIGYREGKAVRAVSCATFGCVGRAKRRSSIFPMASRLIHLDAVLAAREWLAGNRFTAADLLMADVLRVPKLRAFGQFPAVRSYVDRVCSRPTFTKASDDQMAYFAAADKQRRNAPWRGATSMQVQSGRPASHPRHGFSIRTMKVPGAAPRGRLCLGLQASRQSAMSLSSSRKLSNLEMRQSPAFTSPALVNTKLEREGCGVSLGDRPGALVRVDRPLG